RDKLVTGVQTCALPIWPGTRDRLRYGGARRGPRPAGTRWARGGERVAPDATAPTRRRRLAHAVGVRPAGRRAHRPAGRVRPLFPDRSGAAGTSGGPRGVVLAPRAGGRRQ